MDLHNGRTRDLQFTCLLHIHKGGGSKLLSYGQTEQQLYGEQQVMLSVQGGAGGSNVEVVGRI